MKHLYSFLLLTLPLLASAQEFPYTFEVDNIPYEEFDDGNAAVFAAWDDPNAALPVGFDFYFFERQVDTWFLSNDFLGGTLVGNVDITGTSPIFFAYGSDLIDIGYPQDTLISTITYKTTGFAPNRVFHLQYSNCGFYVEVTENEFAANRVNFQVRMYEGSNDIELHFGPHSIKDSEMAHDGFEGPTVLLADSVNFVSGDFDHIWLVNDDPQDPNVVPVTPEQADNLGEADFLQGDPDPNTVYRFTSSFVGIEDQEVAPLSVYPNPSNGHPWVRVPRDWSPTPYTVRSTDGKVVQQGQLNPGVQVLDLSVLPTGMYLLETPVSPAPVRLVKN